MMDRFAPRLHHGLLACALAGFGGVLTWILSDPVLDALQPWVISASSQARAAAIAGIGASLLILMALAAWKTSAERPVRVAMSATALAILVGAGAWDAIRFQELNTGPEYAIERRTAGSLAELVLQVPDRMAEADQLHWLRLHARGYTLVGNAKTLGRAGLAPHRVIGIAQVQVRTVHEDLRLAPGTGSAPGGSMVRIDGNSKFGALWVDTAALADTRMLCAVPSAAGLLLLPPSRVQGCEGA